jgi:hypothetical protein
MGPIESPHLRSIFKSVLEKLLYTLGAEGGKKYLPRGPIKKMSVNSKSLTVIWDRPYEFRIRIICARLTTPTERMQYE